MESVKLRDLLKTVDADTRRCILFLNKKMDEQFKRLMAVKSAPTPPHPPMDVTELRAELRKEIDEIKSYVKGRDKVNKDAIKKFDEDMITLRTYIVDGENNRVPPNKNATAMELLNQGEEALATYVVSNLENSRQLGFECKILINFDDVSDNYLFYHKSFHDTLYHINTNEYEWLEYNKNLNDYPPTEIHRRIEDTLFRLTSVVLQTHYDRNNIHLDPLQNYCLIELIRGSFELYMTGQEDLKPSLADKIIQMERDRENWLPLKAVNYNFAHQHHLINKLEERGGKRNL